MLTGRAQEALSALTTTQEWNHLSVRDAVLKDELVPEAYRQRFRTLTKGDKQTHVEFTRGLISQFTVFLDC